jgi:hypothetical protein
MLNNGDGRASSVMDIIEASKDLCTVTASHNCELGNEPSGSIKCWELPSGCTSCGLSSGTQLHRVS